MDKLDKIIQDKLKNRTITPSPSAWERLSHQLDVEARQKPKRKRFLYVGYAASVVVLVSLFFMLNKDKATTNIDTKEILVERKIDTSKIKKNIFKKNTIKEVIVQRKKEESLPRKNMNSKKRLFLKKQIKKTQIAQNKKKRKDIIKKNDEVISIEKKLKNKTVIVQKETTKSTIKINPDDLLYEVTHTKKEVIDYYAKNNINRKEVLKEVKKQLKKSNLKIDPEIILTAVERDISDDFFKNKFLQKLKSKVSTIVVAIVERNK